MDADLSPGSPLETSQREGARAIFLFCNRVQLQSRAHPPQQGRQTHSHNGGAPFTIVSRESLRVRLGLFLCFFVWGASLVAVFCWGGTDSGPSDARGQADVGPLVGSSADLVTRVTPNFARDPGGLGWSFGGVSGWGVARMDPRMSTDDGEGSGTSSKAVLAV